MVDEAKPIADQQPAVHRIEQALARIDRAAAARQAGHHSLSMQHQALRTSMADAIAAIDGLLGERRG